MNVQIIRFNTSDEGTFGKLYIEEDSAQPPFWCYTAELPYRNNQPDISCVNPGYYPAGFTLTPKHPLGIFMLQVPGRTACEIHSGNYAGDVNKINPKTGSPYRSDVEGCILLGKDIGISYGQKILVESRVALAQFMALMGKEPFQLEIIEQFGAGV